MSKQFYFNQFGVPRGIMVKALNCRIGVSKFELQLFSDKYPGERYEPSYPSSYGLKSITTVLFEKWLWH